MHLRQAVLEDVPRIASIGAAAFADEPIYAHFFPRRHLFPQDYYAYFANDAKWMLASPGHMIVVAEMDESDQDSLGEDGPELKGPTVVGYATFIRTGTAAELAAWNEESFYKKLQRALLYVQGLFASVFAPNRSISKATIRNYYGQAEAIHTTSGAAGRKLDFKTLAIDPPFQRRGIGEELVRFCGMRAIEEKLLVFGDASTKGLPLYVRNGCKDIGHIFLPSQKVEATGEYSERVLDQMEVVVLKWDPAAYLESLQSS